MSEDTAIAEATVSESSNVIVSTLISPVNVNDVAEASSVCKVKSD